LGVARQSHLDTGHADQDQADAFAIEHVAEIFEGRHGKTLGLVDDDQLDMSGAAARRRSALRPHMLLNTDIDAGQQTGQILAQLGERGPHCRRVEDRARSSESRIDLGVRFLSLPPFVKQGLGDVPSCIAPGGKGLSDPGGTMTNTDIAVLANGVGELGKAAMLAGNDEGAGSLAVRMHRHHLSSA